MMKHRPEKDFSAPECQPFHLEGGDHAVLLLHGFTGTAAHMRPLGELLHAQGFTVEGVNLPGHAQSMEAMAQTHWQDWLDAAKEAFCRLQARYQQVSVAGLSMGGCIALLIAEQMHPVSVITISAPMAAEASTCAGSGSMNMLTLLPLACRAVTMGRNSSILPATSKPPSVVISSRRSGTKHTKSGFRLSANSSMEAVAPISKFSGKGISARTARASASCMWRRSSRTCRVMESAPPSIAARAASSTEGSVLCASSMVA